MIETVPPAVPRDSTGKRLRILWVNCRLLHPLNGGDRIRTYNMLKQLKARHDVTYLCFRTPDDPPEAVSRATEFCQRAIVVDSQPVRSGSLSFFTGVLANSLRGGPPFFAEKYRSPELVQHLRRLDEAGEVDLIIIDYLASMIHLSDRGWTPRAPVLLFQHNVESQIWKRHSETTGNPVKRRIFHRQWQMTCDWERECTSRIAGQVTVSEDDRKFLQETLGHRNVLGAVPTGVDLDYFSPGSAGRKPASMVFLGSMDWMANVDAVTHFVADILPLIRQKHPQASVTIVGRNPAPKVKALAESDPGVHVTGTVDDVRPHLAGAEIMILPLRVGGGTRIKIYEAMAAGLPVVSSTIGAEGLPLKHGEHILLADSPGDFARGVCELIEQPARRQQLVTSSLALLHAHFGWAAVTDVFEKYCFAACEARVQTK